MSTVVTFVTHNLWSPLLAMILTGAGMAAIEGAFRRRR